MVNGADRDRRNKVSFRNRFITAWFGAIHDMFGEVNCWNVAILNGSGTVRFYTIVVFQDGKTALDLSLCYGKNFKSYDLSKLLKVVPLYGAF